MRPHESLGASWSEVRAQAEVEAGVVAEVALGYAQSIGIDDFPGLERRIQDVGRLQRYLQVVGKRIDQRSVQAALRSGHDRQERIVRFEAGNQVLRTPVVGETRGQRAFFVIHGEVV